MRGVTSDMAARIREFDWSSTSIGPFEAWPVTWRNAAGLIVDSGFPAALALGPDLIYLYNDAFIPLGGPARHPAALGRPAQLVWGEIWPYLESRFGQTLATGRPTVETDLFMPLVRSGYLEETYMRFSFAVVRDDVGNPSGILCTATENTELVITRRQTDGLRRLATQCAGADSPEEACRLAAAVLEEQGRDIPFALLYRVDRARGGLERMASMGLHTVPETLPAFLPLEATADPWGLAAVASSAAPALIEDVGRRLGSTLRRPQLRPQQAIALAITGTDPAAPVGVFLGGLNPMRPEAESRAFHRVVANHLQAALCSARMKQLAEERVRDLAALDRAKTVFFSNISHELRTPLTLLMGPLRQVLERTTLEPPDRELLETAHKAAGRLQKLINSLLEFSRVEAGRVDARYVPTDLALLTADLAGMFRSVFECAHIALTVECPPTAEPAYVDPEMWAKIVHNLLSNALKFTFEGEVTVRLHSTRVHFELTVTDTGCGIAEADLPRIFQRFSLVRARRARTVEGTGIGLSLAQELTRLHGGTIRVRSRLGTGSHFTVRIPRGSAHLPPERVEPGGIRRSLTPAAEPFLNEALGWLGDDLESRSAPALGQPGTAAHDQSTEPEDEPARARILVVDDNREMRRYLSRILQGRWQVETQADGLAALDHIRAFAPDVVIADVMMPHMDGMEMLRALRAEPTTAEIPVLLLSARAGDEASVEGLQAGANDYLVKPFSSRELIARIEVLLAQARQHAAERQARAQTEQNIRAREEFFAALAHELRAPVSSLFAWLEVLQNEKVTRAKVLGSLEVLELVAKSLRRLSQDIYDVARATLRPMQVAPRPFASIAPLIAAVVEAFEPAAAKKRITLHHRLEPQSGPVSVDPERLQQIVSNLLANAIRYTPADGRIDVTCARRVETVELRVSDSGRGIPPDALPHVFEQYWRGRRAADGEAGLGLGLSICRRLVELHGGEIDAVSEGDGFGATFVMRLPLVAERPDGHEALQGVEPSPRVRDTALATEILAERQVAGDSSAVA